jgi:PKD repeat protein
MKDTKTTNSIYRGAMMKKCLLLVYILSLGFSLFSAIVTDFNPPFYVGQNIGFNKNCHDLFSGFSSCVWTFGDGDSITYSNDSNRGWQYHGYRNPGTYTVKYSRNNPGTTPSCPEIETINVTIEEDRYLQINPTSPKAGQSTQVAAVNFNTPTNIRWDMGDGTIVSANRTRFIQGKSVITHTYNKPGTYTIRAYDWNGDTSNTPVSLVVSVVQPSRNIDFFPFTPRVDQPITFTAINFTTSSIDWNFGNGHLVTGGTNVQVYRYQTAGAFTVSARDSSISHTPVSTPITILPENRYIVANPQELQANEGMTATAYNFRGDYIWWDFGDGTTKSGYHTEKHIYTRPGIYTISARDENGVSQKTFQATVTVRGINDQVNLEIAEISLDNGKYYKVVPKNSKDIRALLRMKMRGTGIVSGYWMIDGQPFELFSEVVYQGQIKEIFTRNIPGIPTLDPGMHTLTMQLTRPSETAVTFPILKYYVLPYENKVELVSPQDALVVKEKEIPQFAWEQAKGGSHYQIAFSNYLYPILGNSNNLQWIDLKTSLNYTPEPEVWKLIKRNRWTYWKVRALDSVGNVLAESDIRDIKVVIATAEITIAKVTDLAGNEINWDNTTIETLRNDIIVHGSVQYMGNSKYLILRVYADEELVDQLLFRDVKKEEIRHFETSIPNKKKSSRLYFQVLKTSSPAVIIGIKGLKLKK